VLALTEGNRNAIIGGVVGPGAFFIIVVVVILCCCRDAGGGNGNKARRYITLPWDHIPPPKPVDEKIVVFPEASPEDLREREREREYERERERERVKPMAYYELEEMENAQNKLPLPFFTEKEVNTGLNASGRPMKISARRTPDLIVDFIPDEPPGDNNSNNKEGQNSRKM
jgi:hypothetical protein